MSDNFLDPDQPVEFPIDGELDLHIFSPSEVRELVPEYLRACREKQILDIRIIHGKGTGALRRTVHALLEAIPWVNDYYLAGPGSGSWGATIAKLDPPVKPDASG
ncbi:Smr/MutS family protein [Balneolaceae bacterium ANBcel3]|nr:Smr/MutS family protein [Balneolaceae bacterium ANBcel3]